MQVGNGAVVVSGSSLFLVLYIFYLAMCIADVAVALNSDR